MKITLLAKFLFDALSFAANPEKTMLQKQQKRGDPFCLQLTPKQAVWMSGTPEAIQEVFTAPIDIFGSLAAEPIEALLGAKSLLILENQEHLREKSIMTPAFH